MKVQKINGNNRHMRVSLKTIVSYLMVLCPIFGIYSSPVPGISLGEILIVIACMLSFGLKMRSNRFKSISTFAIYSLMVTIIMSFVISPINLVETIKETSSFVIYIVAAIILFRRISADELMRAYVAVAKVLAVFLILQFIIYSITGVWIPGLIPGVITDSGLNSSTIISNYSRACSVFEEPAHFAQYVAFPLAYILFFDEKRFSDYIWISIFMISILMSFTGNGILIVCVVFGLYIFFNMDSLYAKKIAKAFGLIIIGVVVGWYVLMNTSLGQTIILRLTSGELLGSADTVYGNSAYVRVIRGYEVYSKFGLFFKVFGVGLGNYEVYATRHAFNILARKAGLFTYLNGIQYYLVSTGLIGLALYLRVLFKNFKNSDLFRKAISILFVAMSLVASFNNGPIWLIAIVILYSKDKYEITANTV